MARLRQGAALAALALALVPAGAQAAEQTGRLLVTLDKAAGVRAASVPARAGVRMAGPEIPALDVITVRPPAGATLTLTAQLLRALPGVARVEVEHRFTPRYAPNDPALTSPDPFAPAVPVEWWALKQNLPTAWGITKGKGATVAIIDTGIDAGHPEFGGKILKTTDNDADPNSGSSDSDQVGHGSHVSSIACGRGNDGVSLVGAGLDCKLLVFKSDFSDASVAASIVQAVDAGADAINMSFGTDGSVPAASIVVRAIDYAYDRGVVLTAAAADEPIEEQGDPSNVLQPTGTGNDITQGKGLSVTSANFSDGRSSFAGRGSQISIAAYGSYSLPGGPPGIFGAFPGNHTDLETARLGSPACNCRTTFGSDNRYAYLQGTSMSSPMVAAVAALVGNFNTDLGAGDIIRLLKQTARRPSADWSPELGWGILDGGAALTAARTLDKRAPKSRIKSAKTLSTGKVKLTISRSNTAPPGVVASKLDKVQIWRSYNGRKAVHLTSTTKDSISVSATRGVRYEFFTIAKDRAGNREKRPSKPDVVVKRPKK